MTDHPSSEARRILRLPDVLARTGMKRSWVYREIAAGRFPKPVKIGRASGWDSDAIEAYLTDILGCPAVASAFVRRPGEQTRV